MAFSGRLTISARGEVAAASPYSNNVRALFSHDEPYTDTAAAVYYQTLTIGATSTTAIDLTTITDAFGTALGSTAVYTMIISTPSTNGGTVTVSPSSSDGWTGLLADASDVLNLSANSRLIIDSTAGIAVSGSSKDLDFGNATGSAQTVSLFVVAKT